MFRKAAAKASMAAALAAWQIASPTAAFSGEVFKGPVAARVLEVHDGDTFLAEALVWPGQSITVHVRVRGIDAPELRARCPAERQAALRARAALAELTAGGAVAISNIAGAKYFGRVLADVEGPTGPVGPALLARGLVRAYDGGRRAPWCG